MVSYAASARLFSTFSSALHADTLLEESSGELKQRLEAVGITPAELNGPI